MKSMIMPTTAEELIVFLEQHDLVGTITEFETSAGSGMSQFGFPLEVTIKLSMSCQDKADANIKVELIK